MTDEVNVGRGDACVQAFDHGEAEVTHCRHQHEATNQFWIVFMTKLKAVPNSTARKNDGAPRTSRAPRRERIPNATAQTRIVSKARIRLDSRKSVRSFKAIICVDISEFESCMPSHAVGLSQVRSPAIVMHRVALDYGH
jgi:hypothetical protein